MRFQLGDIVCFPGRIGGRFRVRKTIPAPEACCNIGGYISPLARVQIEKHKTNGVVVMIAADEHDLSLIARPTPIETNPNGGPSWL